MKVFKRAANYVRSCDSFGEPVGVNLKGKSTHNTIMGSLVTLAALSFTMYYGFIKMT